MHVVWEEASGVPLAAHVSAIKLCVAVQFTWVLWCIIRCSLVATGCSVATGSYIACIRISNCVYMLLHSLQSERRPQTLPLYPKIFIVLGMPLVSIAT